MSETTAVKNMDEIVALCRRRGFIWQSSEIYGGINGFWDYGPLGAQLKRNLKNAWWQDVIEAEQTGPDGRLFQVVPVDCTIIMHPKVWEASGHASGFNDPMVDDKETKQRFRADHLVGCFVAPHDFSNKDEWITLQSDFQNAMIGGTFPTKWELVATTIGSYTEAHAAFVGQKKLGRYKVIRGSQEIEHTSNGITVSQLSIRVEDSQGNRMLVNIMPLSLQMIAADPKIIPSPFTGNKGELTEPRAFNLMFDTYCGAIKDEENKAWLRPETAQGIFTQFWNVVDTSRVKVPFGIAQVGKAFRNEVTPRNFTFRSREFEQMEIEFFIPDPAVVGEEVARTRDWYAWWRDTRYAWWKSIGLASENLILREHEKDELAHYAKEGAGTSDVEYRFPFTAPGFGELEGIAHRSNYDLRQHATHSGKGDKLRYFDQERNAHYFPHVIEPSAGADRGTLAVLCEAYTPTPDRAGSKAIMKFHPRLAPIKAGIFPLVGKDGMPEVADRLYQTLRRKYACQYDEKQSIGKRYARMDEAGTPYCFTIDGDTLTSQTVTVRDRDTASQQRIAIDKVEAFLAEKIG